MIGKTMMTNQRTAEVSPILISPYRATEIKTPLLRIYAPIQTSWSMELNLDPDINSHIYEYVIKT